VPKKVAVLAAAVCVVAAGAVVVLARDEPGERFCNAAAALPRSEPKKVVEWTLYVGEPAELRRACAGDDLWHYLDSDLARVDGVLFDDCIVSWVDGGRASAGEAGIDCTPMS
jgi:hypothetical protein